MNPTLAQLADELRAQTRPLMVCTGAGVSLASGIPTFRGSEPGAVWKADVTELGTHRYFRQDPVESWRWYLGRFDRLSDKEPNAAHHALVALERWKRRLDGPKPLNNFVLVTQNVDGLHRKAGSQLLIEVHGNADTVRCSRDGCENGAPDGTLPRDAFDLDAFRAGPSLETLPRCPACQSLLRPHVLWFDEYYTGHASFRYDAVMQTAAQVGLLLFVGTSHSVGITANLLSIAASRGVPVWNLDPAGEAPADWVRHLPLKAEEALPQLVAMLA